MAGALTSSARRAPRLRVRCPAKINLGFWILGRRRDGYHEVDSILQTVALEDELILDAGPPGLSFTSRGRAIRGPGPNLVERAWALLEEAGHLPRDVGASVRLTKRIPVGAGLGGGSSDAAGLLAGADRLFGLGLSPSELTALARRLGSDVPFFLQGGTAHATGRGDKVRHLCPAEPFWVVLLSPPIEVSTSWAYGLLRNSLTPHNAPSRLLASAIERRDRNGVPSAMYNAFEDVILPQLPEIVTLKRALVTSGAKGALLSGSGSTVFGLTHSRMEAQAVANAVRDCPAEIRVVRTIERGVTISELV